MAETHLIKRPPRAANLVPLAEYIELAMRRARVTGDNTGYTGTVPLLKGCISCGGTQQEALENLKDAIEAWVLTGLRFGDPIPPMGKAVLACGVDRERP